MLGDELEGQSITAGGHTIGLLILASLNGAVGGTVRVAAASRRPLVSVITVSRSTDYPATKKRQVSII